MVEVWVIELVSFPRQWPTFIQPRLTPWAHLKMQIKIFAMTHGKILHYLLVEIWVNTIIPWTLNTELILLSLAGFHIWRSHPKSSPIHVIQRYCLTYWHTPALCVLSQKSIDTVNKGIQSFPPRWQSLKRIGLRWAGQDFKGTRKTSLSEGDGTSYQRKW